MTAKSTSSTCDRNSRGSASAARLFTAARRDLAQSGLKSLIVWALSENDTAVEFYRALGGKAVARSSEKFGTRVLDKVAFGWNSSKSPIRKRLDDSCSTTRSRRWVGRRTACSSHQTPQAAAIAAGVAVDPKPLDPRFCTGRDRDVASRDPGASAISRQSAALASPSEGAARTRALTTA